MICTENRSSFFFTPWICSPSGVVSVTGAYPVLKSFTLPRICRVIAARARATPMRDRSGPRRPPLSPTRWHPTQLAAKMFCPALAFPADAPGAADAASVLRYARMRQMSMSDVRGAGKAGISVAVTPLRMVPNSLASVLPFAQTCVMSGPRMPRASMPWQSAQRTR